MKYNKYLVGANGSVLIPSNEPYKIEYSLSFINFFFEFLDLHPQNFEIFWNLFKTYYLIVFYSDISKEIGILDKFNGKYITYLIKLF